MGSRWMCGYGEGPVLKFRWMLEAGRKSLSDRAPSSLQVVVSMEMYIVSPSLQRNVNPNTNGSRLAAWPSPKGSGKQVGVLVCCGGSFQV